MFIIKTFWNFEVILLNNLLKIKQGFERFSRYNIFIIHIRITLQKRAEYQINIILTKLK